MAWPIQAQPVPSLTTLIQSGGHSFCFLDDGRVRRRGITAHRWKERNSDVGPGVPHRPDISPLSSGWAEAGEDEGPHELGFASYQT